MPPSSVARAIVVLLALGAGCSSDPSGPEDSNLTAALEQQQEAHAALAERLDALETALEGSVITQREDRLAHVEDALEDMAGQVDRLAEQLLAEGEARLAFAEGVDELEGQLRSALADVRDATNALQAQIDDLQVRYEVLQERIDRIDRSRQ